MKVRCIRLEDVDGNEVAQSSWLELGRAYTVLSVETSSKNVMLRVDSETGPVLHHSTAFEVIDTSIPTTWRVSLTPSELTLEPEAWSKDDFWGDYFDGISEAVKTFEEEKLKILAADQ